MDASNPCPFERSPLDQIRQVEAEIARQVAAAQRDAEETVQRAQAQASELRRHARDIGRLDGQAQYREIISQAAEEARIMVEQAHRQAENLYRQGEDCMDDVVRRAVEIVIGHKRGI